MSDPIPGEMIVLRAGSRALSDLCDQGISPKKDLLCLFLEKAETLINRNIYFIVMIEGSIFWGFPEAFKNAPKMNRF